MSDATAPISFPTRKIGISISIPIRLLEKVDEDAARHQTTRSEYVAAILARHLEADQANGGV